MPSPPMLRRFPPSVPLDNLMAEDSASPHVEEEVVEARDLARDHGPRFFAMCAMPQGSQARSSHLTPVQCEEPSTIETRETCMRPSRPWTSKRKMMKGMILGQLMRKILRQRKTRDDYPSALPLINKNLTIQMLTILMMRK